MSWKPYTGSPHINKCVETGIIASVLTVGSSAQNTHFQRLTQIMIVFMIEFGQQVMEILVKCQRGWSCLGKMYARRFMESSWLSYCQYLASSTFISCRLVHQSKHAITDSTIRPAWTESKAKENVGPGRQCCMSQFENDSELYWTQSAEEAQLPTLSPRYIILWLFPIFGRIKNILIGWEIPDEIDFIELVFEIPNVIPIMEFQFICTTELSVSKL
jgi:hypothetical protein